MIQTLKKIFCSLTGVSYEILFIVTGTHCNEPKLRNYLNNVRV
jgi:hypothetical protein